MAQSPHHPQPFISESHYHFCLLPGSQAKMYLTSLGHALAWVPPEVDAETRILV